jgi:hypothetical protein
VLYLYIFNSNAKVHPSRLKDHNEKQKYKIIQMIFVIHCDILNELKDRYLSLKVSLASHYSYVATWEIWGNSTTGMSRHGRSEETPLQVHSERVKSKRVKLCYTCIFSTVMLKYIPLDWKIIMKNKNIK